MSARRRLAAYGALVVAADLTACNRPAVVTNSALTFNKDIAPIVWRRCSGCHRPGEIGPFSLLTYDDVRSHADKIAEATRRRIMPPWLPEPGYGAFQNERRLTSDELDRIQRWIEQGTPEGNPADRPPPPTWTAGWQLGQPDLVVELAEAYTLRPSESDVFRNFVIPIPIDSARWVRGLEVRPGNNKMLHHMTIGIDRTRASRRLDDEDPEPGFSGGMFSETTNSPDNRALGWTPGMMPVMEPADMPWRLDKGSDLVLQLHLMAPHAGMVETIRPSVGFFFTNTAPTRRSIDFRLGSKTIDIPAGQADYAIEDTYALPVDVDLLSVYPHAHYLGDDINVLATLPDGTVKPLIWIKHWNFRWQDQYRYVEPVYLPKGTVLTMRYTYDNSDGNPHNPHHPPVHVSYGPQSTDEMGDLWLRFVPRDPGDADILARSYMENESRKDVNAAEQLVARNPRDARWRSLLGARRLESGRVPEAIAEFEEALHLDPRNIEAHNNLGHVFRLQGRLPEALAQFREAARLAPSNDLVELNLANTLEDLGQGDEALPHYRRALALNPDAAGAHNDFGAALASRGLIDEAIEHFSRAVELRPDDADAQRNLAQAQQVRAGVRRN